MTRGAGRVLFLVAAAFVLSGASGLVYQVLWQRLLALSFGVTTYATATVLASFMAGLALGGFLGGRLADRSQRPLFWYGVVEIVVGLTAALTPSAFVGLQSAYAAAHAAIGPDLAPIARITAAFLILIVPTAAMGASFPLVVKAGLGAGSIGTRAISLLYATNTLGAVAGALLAGFVLIGTLGVSASIWIAAAVSAGVGIAACVFGRSPMAPTVVAARGQGSDRSDSADDRLRRVLPLLLFISGLCSIAYEVVWTRLLVLFLETTTFAFTVMLATFLMGITAGSFAVTPFIRGVGNAARALAWLQGLVAVASLASLFLFARIDALAALLRGDSASGLAAMATLSFVALFPPALLLGMSFPIAVAAYAGQRGDSGRGVGALYATNVAGAIVGALGAGFVLIPLIGIQRSLVVLAALNWIAAAIAALADRRDGWRGRLSTLVPTLVLTLGLALATPSAFKSLVAGRFPGERLVWLDEGLETTVTITRDS
jgi:spermidine synthase